jgi:hypothetical protein
MYSNYPPARLLRTGVILLTRSDTFQSRFIQWVLRSPWSHATVIVVIGGQPYCLEAVFGKTLAPVAYETWRTERKREVKLLPTRIYSHEIMAYSGLPYDVSSCWNHFLQRLTGRWYGSEAGRGMKKIYCFEMIARLLHLPQPWKAGPTDIINFVRERVTKPVAAARRAPSPGCAAALAPACGSCDRSSGDSGCSRP